MKNYVTVEQYQRTLKRSKFWLFTTLLLICINAVLAICLFISMNSKVEVPIITGSGTMQKIADNMYEIVNDSEDSNKYVPPSLPEISEVSIEQLKK